MDHIQHTSKEKGLVHACPCCGSTGFAGREDAKRTSGMDSNRTTAKATMRRSCEALIPMITMKRMIDNDTHASRRASCQVGLVPSDQARVCVQVRQDLLQVGHDRGGRGPTKRPQQGHGRQVIGRADGGAAVGAA